MPNPKRRHSKSRGAKRRTHYKASVPAIVTCPNCGSAKQPHIVCHSCGYYNGRKILEID